MSHSHAFAITVHRITAVASQVRASITHWLRDHFDAETKPPVSEVPRSGRRFRSRGQAG